MNFEERRIVNMGAWGFTQRSYDIATVLGQQFYSLPGNYRKLIGNPVMTTSSLGYDTQTANFTVGLVLTGGTSGAKGTIAADSDDGTTGTLTLTKVTGLFADDETITDSSTGSAKADGTLAITSDVPTEAPNRAFWDRLNSSNTTSNTPEYFYIFNGEIGFYPTPIDATRTITLPYELQATNLSLADYTTDSVASATNGDRTITSALGTTWTTAMVGRYIKLTASDTATSGDEVWYEIASRTDDDNIELVRPYQGTTFTGGTTAYIIGQITVLPDGYDMIPVYYACEIYYIEKDNPARSDRFKRLKDDLTTQLMQDRGTKTSSLVIDGGYGVNNPNLYISTASDNA